MPNITPPDLRPIDGIFIRHHRYKSAIARIDECRHSFGLSAEPECMLILGPTGVGKSTLIRGYAAENPASREAEGATIPVLAATIPIPATMGNMASSMLEGLGDPHFTRGTLNQKTARLRHLIRVCRVELIMLDEFQHFIDARSDRVLSDVSDWLKNLISETSVPVVLVGLPKSLNVLKVNDQLRRRFSHQIKVEPFGWSSDPARAEFRKILNAIDQALPIGPNELADHAERFFAATGGLISNVMKLVRAAGKACAAAGKSKIDLPDFAKAFAERIIQDPDRPNPFNPMWNRELMPKRIAGAAD